MPKFNLSDAKGVIPALITPFDEDEKLDESRMRNCIDFLIERGVGALYTTGSTGETFLMSPDERALVVEVVVENGGGVGVGVGVVDVNYKKMKLQKKDKV